MLIACTLIYLLGIEVLSPVVIVGAALLLFGSAPLAHCRLNKHLFCISSCVVLCNVFVSCRVADDPLEVTTETCKKTVVIHTIVETIQASQICIVFAFRMYRNSVLSKTRCLIQNGQTTPVGQSQILGIQIRKIILFCQKVVSRISTYTQHNVRAQMHPFFCTIILHHVGAVFARSVHVSQPIIYLFFRMNFHKCVALALYQLDTASMLFTHTERHTRTSTHTHTHTPTHTNIHRSTRTHT